VSSTLGASTITGWNRRSSAASFSTYLRYSSSVVGADAVQLPARQHGLEHVPASVDPSVRPAPNDVVQFVR